jgi:two-component system sensor histidine kinase BaeS
VAAGVEGRGGGFVFVLSASPETDRTVWRSPLALAGVSALAFALALSIWFSNRLTRPIRRLQSAAGAIASGDLSVRVEPESADEVGDLAESFNAMAGELERSRRAERSFVMSVSHDLRTPLTSIKGYGEAIADGAVTGEAAVRAGRVIESEASRLERLVHDLLDLARLDAREFRLHEQVVDLADDLAELADSFAPRVENAGLSFHASGVPLPPTRTDPDRVVQVVANLLENALRYTPAGGRIELHWSTCPPSEGYPHGAARIDVSDSGRGIPPEVVGHVFERLYVAEHIPGERPEGTGLGLAIVSELTRALGGSVAVHSEVGRGSVFSVWIPIRV